MITFTFVTLENFVLMSSPKRTLKIFFASSGALGPFREEFSRVISQINKWHDHLYLEVVKWETDIESGSYEAENVQAEINPLLEDSEVVFVAVYDRIGKFTLEEYHLARMLGKKVFVYFFKRDSEPEDEASAFRKQLEAENKSLERKIDYSTDTFGKWVLVDLNAYLYRQRIEQLPSGFHWVFPKNSIQKSSALRYQDYLQDNILPYFSRDYFKRNLHIAEEFITEADILAHLLTDRPNESARYHGCIIFGEGGIGKTRLMLELGYRAIAQNWIPIRVDSKVEDVETLTPYLKPGRKYVLLFDYIEESRGFNSDLSTILADGSGSLVRVIANCRNTFSSSSSFPDDSTFLPVHLDAESSLQQQYEADVIRYILEEVQVELGEDRMRFHLIKPSFAVFLRFLWFNDYITESDVRQVGDFKRWIKRRMQLTFGLSDFRQIDSEVIYALSILPIPREQLFSNAKRRGLLQKMISDGWVEVSEGEHTIVRPIHDTITDELLVIHLEGKRGDVAGEIEGIWQYAIQNESLSQCFRAFERIRSQIPGWKEDGFFQFFQNYLKRSPTQFAPVMTFFGITSLLNELQRVQLFLQFSDFFQPYLSSTPFANSLCFTMQQCIKGKLEIITSAQLKDIFEEWYSNNSHFELLPNINFRVISTYVKLFGIDERSTTWVQNYVSQQWVLPSASFVIDAWLIKGGGSQLVRPLVKKYLRFWASEKEAQYVFKAWLDAGEDKKLVEVPLQTYLAHNAIEKGAQYVFKAWLDADGDKKLMEVPLQTYLAHYAADKESSFIFQAWLDAGGDKKLVEVPLQTYLAHNAIEKGTQYVFKAWLDAGGDKKLVEVPLQTYLAHNAIEKGAQYVIKSWLDAGGDKKLVEVPLQTYLAHNAIEKGAQYVFKAWLDAGGDKKLVEVPLQTYLAHNAIEKGSQYVFKAWLDAGGDKKLVKDSLQTYLAHNAADKESSYIFQAWFDAGGDMQLVENPLQTYLAHNAAEKESSFVLQTLLGKDEDIFNIRNALKTYLDQNAEEINTSFILQAWLRSTDDIVSTKALVKRYLIKNAKEKEASFVLQAWLDRSDDIEWIQDDLRTYLETNAEDKNSRHIIKSWLRAGGDKGLINSALKRYLSKNAEEMEAFNVLNAWLREGGDKRLIEKELFRHIQNNPTKKNSKKIFISWLKVNVDENDLAKLFEQYLVANIDKREACYALVYWMQEKRKEDEIKIQTLVDRYLTQYAQEKEAGLVLRIWLDWCKDVHLIEKYLNTFISQNGYNKEMSYIFHPWLEKGGAPKAIQYPLKAYLHKNILGPEARFILVSWLRNRGDKKWVEAELIRHLEAFNTHEDTIYIFSAWIKSDGDTTLITPYLQSYLQINANYFPVHVFYLEALKKEQYREIIKSSIPIWLEANINKKEALRIVKSWLLTYEDVEPIAYLLSQILEINGAEFSATYFYQEWLRQDKNLALVQSFLIDWLNTHVADLRAGYTYEILLNGQKLRPVFEPIFLDWHKHHKENAIAKGLFRKYQNYIQQE